MALTIAIDGPVGAGKSTIASMLAHSLGILHLDTGAMYRALALKALRRRVDKEELSQSQQAGFIYLILCTVSGVAAGLQNTG